jgi:hypothetical protein
MTVKTKNISGSYTNLPSITFDDYWSSTKDASYTNNAWRGYFYDGVMESYRKNLTYIHTICTHD